MDTAPPVNLTTSLGEDTAWPTFSAANSNNPTANVWFATKATIYKMEIVSNPSPNLTGTQ